MFGLHGSELDAVKFVKKIEVVVCGLKFKICQTGDDVCRWAHSWKKGGGAREKWMQEVWEECYEDVDVEGLKERRQMILGEEVKVSQVTRTVVGDGSWVKALVRSREKSIFSLEMGRWRELVWREPE